MNMNSQPGGMPNMNNLPIQGKFELNDPDAEKNRLVAEYKIAGTAAEKLKYIDGVWTYQGESAEKYFKNLEELYKDNDNSEMYKH
jgi:VCBS repeat-containing protein